MFDFDGVIADSMPMQEQAWKAAMRSPTVTLSNQQKATLLKNLHEGRAGQRIFADSGIDFDVQARLRLMKDSIWAEKRALVPPIHGAIAGIKRLCSIWPLAVATTSPRAYVEPFLEKFGILECFSCVVSGDEVPNLKPAPDAILIISDFLSLPPCNMLVIGDTISDMEMANAAGSRFFLFSSESLASRLRVENFFEDWKSMVALLCDRGFSAKI